MAHARSGGDVAADTPVRGLGRLRSNDALLLVFYGLIAGSRERRMLCCVALV